MTVVRDGWLNVQTLKFAPSVQQQNLIYLESPVPGAAPDGDELLLIDTIASQDFDPERMAVDSISRHELVAAIAMLPDRERDVITARFMIDTPLTFDALGHIFGLSRNRIQQIQNQAIIHLRQIMQDEFDITDGELCH